MLTATHGETVDSNAASLVPSDQESVCGGVANLRCASASGYVVRTLHLRNGRTSRFAVVSGHLAGIKADMAGVAVVAVVALARGHGSIIMPPSRNSIDATLPPWSNGNHPETGLIESVNLCILHPLTPLSDGGQKVGSAC